MGVLAVPNLRARSLRTNATDAERSLWQQLRLLKAEGRHFRRQVPIAGYIADFACHSCRLAIELDGGQHNDPENILHDRQRTEKLKAHGYMTLRYWNNEVVFNLEGVVDAIRHHAGLATAFEHKGTVRELTPTPSPSPQGGGEPY